MIDEYLILQERYAAAQIETEAAQAKLFANLGGTIYRDGDMWFALIGPNDPEGCCGFSETRWGALHECLENFNRERPAKKKQA
jgi:hypothetical protein